MGFVTIARMASGHSDPSAATPLVSAVIPAYNAEPWIGETLRSVLAQSYPRIEVIAVDDGSRDRTEHVIRSFGERVRYVRQENGGVSRARNQGAAHARGEFLAFLDADDLWAPTKIARQVSRLQARPEAVASFTDCVYLDARTRRETPATPSRLEPDLVAGLLLHSCIVGNASTVMVRRTIFERLAGFDPAFSNNADWDLWIRLAELGPVDVLNEPLARYRVHSVSMSTDPAVLERDTLGVLAKFFSAPERANRYAPLRDRIYANQYLKLSGAHLHAGNLRASLTLLARATSHQPAALLRALGMPARAMARVARRVLATRPA